MIKELDIVISIWHMCFQLGQNTRMRTLALVGYED